MLEMMNNILKASDYLTNHIIELDDRRDAGKKFLKDKAAFESSKTLQVEEVDKLLKFGCG
jgi:hypothetical protein